MLESNFCIWGLWVLRTIQVEHLKEGMVLSKPIYSANGIILLSEGTTLTPRYIDKIIASGTKTAYIEDEISKGLVVDVVIRDDTKIETKKTLQNIIGKIKTGQFDATPELLKKTEAIINEVLDNPMIMTTVQEIRDKNNYLFLHSINVGVLSVLLGKRLGYNDIQLKHLAVGGMLHDVGKIDLKFDSARYRTDYVEKEWDTYVTHPTTGYEYMLQIPTISLTAANIVRMHHENYDGTGFPTGLKGDEILESAQIVSIVNEYDSLLYTNPFGKKMKHYEIIEFIIAKTYHEFSPKIVKLFSESVAPYPLSSGVILSDGRKAIVSKLNPEFPTRPTVRVLNDEGNEVVEEIDLVKVPSLLIADEKDIDK